MKSIHTLNLLLLLYTNSTKLLLKIDDDSFLNLPKLSKVLLQKSANDGTKKIFGSVNKHVLVFYPKGEEEKQEKYLRKWRIPTYFVQSDSLPKVYKWRLLYHDLPCCWMFTEEIYGHFVLSPRRCILDWIYCRCVPHYKRACFRSVKITNENKQLGTITNMSWPVWVLTFPCRVSILSRFKTKEKVNLQNFFSNSNKVNIYLIEHKMLWSSGKSEDSRPRGHRFESQHWCRDHLSCTINSDQKHEKA